MINTMIALTNAMIDLDETQSWINHARNAAPANPTVQDKLDHHQADINRKADTIRRIVAEIASRN